MAARTDRHNNPAAIITDVAAAGGLVLGVDYEVGDKFPDPSNLHTARLLGDPVQLTIRVIDKISYYTKDGRQRWTYIAIPKFVWDGLDPATKKKVIGFHYQHEGGETMKSLFV